MTKEIRTADATWFDLQKPGKFEEFFQGFLKLLKKKLPQIEVKGKFAYSRNLKSIVFVYYIN